MVDFEPSVIADITETMAQAEQILEGDPDNFLRRTVQDLFSLKNRTVVITGGARGIGLALAFAVAEVGGNVAIIDVLKDPHPHYEKLKQFDVKVRLYKQVHPGLDVTQEISDCYRSDVTNFSVLKRTFDEIVTDFGRIDGL